MEFSLPIRIRWDVDFRERSGRVKRIARKIAEACPLFVELRPGATSAGAGAQLDRFCRQFFGPMLKEFLVEGHDPFTLGLQKVEDMYLDTRVTGTAGLSRSYLLSAIALGILLIACVNFMNLSIGSSSARSVEV